MKTSESIIKIVPALLKAQKAIGAAKKGATNPFFHSKYADLGSVMEACKDELNGNGVVILQPVVGTMVETVLLHESGEWMTSETPIICATQNDPQKLGSAITYARRYGLQSMLFIPAEDDDGNGASNGKPVAPKTTTHPQKAEKDPTDGWKDPRSTTETIKAPIVEHPDLGKCKDCGAVNIRYTTGTIGCKNKCWSKRIGMKPASEMKAH